MTDAARESHSIASAVLIGIRAVRRHPMLGALLLIATVGQGALQGLLVWALREVLVSFSASDSSYLILSIGAATVLAIWWLRALSTFAGEIVSARLARRVEIESMQRVLAKLLTLSVRFFERSSQGDLVMTSYQDMRGIRTVTLALGSIVLSVSRLAGLAVVAWLMSPKLAVIGLVAVPLGVLPAYWLGQRITAAARQERGAIETLYDSFLQVSSGIRVIRVNRGERSVLERARSIGRKLYRHAVRQAEVRSLARLFLEAVSGLGLIAVLTVGGRDVAVGALDWQSLLSLLVAVMAVYGPILTLLQQYGSIWMVIPNLDRISAILNASTDVPDVPDAHPLRDAPKTIALQEVSFAYDDRAVLDSISATFYEGETIGIVGPSGAGKSTLMALLLRLYDPSHGRILYDGVDLRHIRHGDLMDKCAIVLQEPFLFIDTIANNIRFARPDASMEDVIAAARAANIHDEIVQTHDGYQTVIGHSRDGHGVSVGQKQRICIAGALLKNAPILFLDEATSNLDSVSEHAVQAAIEKLMAGRTSFVVAHRLSTLRRVDRILVLDQGRMVGLGTHTELLARCETYHRLWSAQVEPREVEPRATPSSRVS